mmetsp:Transcript_6891/g.11971  ORF Transcript_6891/g.11971 Transcript_6891/m.11971 type:complete len:118 (+) Transcript_6891:86-439(+)
MISRTLSSKLAQAREETRMLRAGFYSTVDEASGRKLWPRLKESDTLGAAIAASIEAKALTDQAEEQARTIARLRRQVDATQKQFSDLTATFVAFIAFVGLLLLGSRSQIELLMELYP